MADLVGSDPIEAIDVQMEVKVRLVVDDCVQETRLSRTLQMGPSSTDAAYRTSNVDIQKKKMWWWDKEDCEKLTREISSDIWDECL
jgi:hypothetical protein